MITPQEIRKKAERKYIDYLKSLVSKKPFDKLIIRGDKKYTKSSLPEFEKEIQAIVSQSKEKSAYGYSLDFQQVKTKHLGTQDLPISIYFETEQDFLKFLGNQKEVDFFKLNVKKITNVFPYLEEWIINKPIKVIQNEKKWDDILKVCLYFKNNPLPSLYVRELPIKIHTKFIEDNKGVIKELLDVVISDYIQKDKKQFEKRFNLKYAEPQIRFKVLDQEISQTFFSGLDDIAIQISQFENLHLPIEKVIVFENKTNFYTALTLPKMRKTIALFGSGFRVYNLKNVKWFKDKTILYWGDLDAQGFEILSQFRGYFPNVKSIFMDKKTFNKFFENDNGTLSKVLTKLNLTEKEKMLYDILKENNWRLEQEKIPLDYVNSYFEKEYANALNHTH
ncbi:Wadjet anti-phage system protein JetD domain-containing protein [Maribacter ulvicola]|uniref:Wadjet protein JetD C-terminal domain-containing protein n=1 Tax=Maribacter ulvicola TaxID=228959 RepID=A0A1N6UQ82_9FLAO|nr:DUF3322 and DUF2220 domain-containing protein [Maribacter ulvicola]SIQ67838.1 hypothetical protein SAMN05421797_102429 [Maribacter ulvicola]